MKWRVASTEPLEVLCAGSSDWQVAEALQQHPFCVCSAQGRWTLAAKGPKNRSRQATAETPEKRRYQLRKAPGGLQLTEAPHPPSPPPTARFSGRPGLILPLLCRRPCFRPLWAPLTGGDPAPPIQQTWVAAVGTPDATNNRNGASLALWTTTPRKNI